MTIDVYNLFPIPLGIKHSWREPTVDEKEFFTYAQTKERKQNDGNTHTKDIYILDVPEMAELKNDLTTAINSYFQEVWKPLFDVEVYITVSWINYTDKGQHHHGHIHRNSLISGVYYLDTDDSDKITFGTPHEEMLTMSIRTEEWNEWNSNEWHMPTPKNSLLLFPSKLRHKVLPTTNPNTRTSLSFNTFIKGRLHDGGQEIFL